MKFGARRWIAKLLVPETDRAERRPGSQFAAYYYCDSTLREDPVKDISSSGVYILTKERWIRGTEIFLTLQNSGPLERSRERRITTKARVIRWGNDGVALAFVVTDDPIAREWNELVESLVEQAKLADMEDLVRMVEALAFLNQVCSGAVEVMELFRARLSSHKLRNAVEIALKAQRTVGANLAAPRRPIHGLLFPFSKTGPLQTMLGFGTSGRAFWSPPSRRKGKTIRMRATSNCSANSRRFRSAC